MWLKEYRDYKKDQPIKKYTLQPGEMQGCEMHELFGWGNYLHKPKKKKKGFFSTLLTHFFSSSKEEAKE